MRLQDKVAFITGAGRGIGRAIAEGFAREGAHLVLLSRTVSELEAVATTIQAYERQVLIYPADVRDATAVQAAVVAAQTAFGRIDILLNVAGVPMVAPTLELSYAEWDTTIGINLTGSFLCCQAVGRVMLAQQQGSIINIGSLTSCVGFPMRAAYAAAKTGIIGLTRALAVEWASHGVRVNVLIPGWIHTELQDTLVAQGKLHREPIVNRTPLQRIGQVHDLLGPALFLASDESAFVTGETLTVDGGWLANGYF